MSKLRARGEAIRHFIIENVESHPSDIARITAHSFGCSRQAVNSHLRSLVADGSLAEEGRTRSKTYRLVPLVNWSKTYALTPQLSESAVWSADLAPMLGTLPDNVRGIWQHGLTEMLNNAIDHSEGKSVRVHLEHSASRTTAK